MLEMMTATYDPADNKLRLRSDGRLPSDLYKQVKAAGFIWAPKQAIFVAPAWSPDREDLLIELCGEIGDEDTTLVHRAEQRAERFEEYSEKRADDAERAKTAVEAITDNIPLGQPILVGHHSERHARRDAERIHNGMSRAIRLWETAEYWKRRAEGALRAAKYKERPDVRHRRIKGLEADKRKQERIKTQAEKFLKAWQVKNLTKEIALHIANYDYCHIIPQGRENETSVWNALNEGYITPEDAAAHCIPIHHRQIENADRWIRHLDNRLAYEKAMLDEAGGTAADKWQIEVGGQVFVRGKWLIVVRLSKSGDVINSVSTSSRYVARIEEIKDYRPPAVGDADKVKAATKLAPLCNYPGEGFRPITQAEWDKKAKDYKITKVIAATPQHAAHRVRHGVFSGSFALMPVFITDAKRKDPPVPESKSSAELPPQPEQHIVPAISSDATVERRPEDDRGESFRAMRETLAKGVKVEVVPQLFPTPPELASRMVKLAGVGPGQRILEPNAGTGVLLKKCFDAACGVNCGRFVAVEINPSLVNILEEDKGLRLYSTDYNYKIICADFLSLSCDDLGKFDRVVMNPPFENGADIKNILHAQSLLKPGGRLVALCANGPRQREAFMEKGEYWEELPEGTFKEQGTMVRVALVVLSCKSPHEERVAEDEKGIFAPTLF